MSARHGTTRVALALFLSGLLACSSATDNKNTMSKADVEAVTGELMAIVAQGLATSGPRPPTAAAARMVDGLVTSNMLVNESVSLTVACPDGGSVHVGGSMTGSISDATQNSIGGTGVLSFGATETITDCKIGKFVVNGDPHVTAAATLSFLSWDMSYPATMSIGGGFKVTGGANTSCSIQLSVLMYATSIHISGSSCGQQVDQTF